jgi:3-isopropylmalate/(R)-2-methylmalate dehydratase small subunit
MNSFTKHTGLVATLDRVHVDTDQIIPKQFLKRIERTGFGQFQLETFIERTGFGQFLFFDWRFNEDGSLNESFELNQPRFQDASILIARTNFGCGSSREHAPWALQDYGFRVIIAPSFADIFYNNCLQNGLLPIHLTEEEVEQIFQQAKEAQHYRLTIDLEEQTISDGAAINFKFELDAFRRDCLLKGLDDIGLTLQQEDMIRQYEARQQQS